MVRKHTDLGSSLGSSASGTIEAKKVGYPLTGVELQNVKYRTGLPVQMQARESLPFAYQSTGVETRFTAVLPALGEELPKLLEEIHEQLAA